MKSANKSGASQGSAVEPHTLQEWEDVRDLGQPKKGTNTPFQT